MSTHETGRASGSDAAGMLSFPPTRTLVLWRPMTVMGVLLSDEGAVVFADRAASDTTRLVATGVHAVEEDFDKVRITRDGLALCLAGKVVVPRPASTRLNLLEVAVEAARGADDPVTAAAAVLVAFRPLAPDVVAHAGVGSFSAQPFAVPLLSAVVVAGVVGNAVDAAVVGIAADGTCRLAQLDRPGFVVAPGGLQADLDLALADAATMGGDSALSRLGAAMTYAAVREPNDVSAHWQHVTLRPHEGTGELQWHAPPSSADRFPHA